MPRNAPGLLRWIRVICHATLAYCPALLSLFLLHNIGTGQEAALQIVGDRSFRIPGIAAKLIVANDSVAIVSDQRGNLTGFDVDDGRVVSEFSVQLKGEEYIASSAHTRDGQLFALAFGRHVQVRSTSAPSKLVMAVSLPEIVADNFFSTPTLDVAFSWDSCAVYVHDEAFNDCTEINLSTGKQRKMFEIDEYVELVSGWKDKLWFHSSESLVLANTQQVLRRFPAKDEHWYMSVASTESAIYTVCNQPSVGSFSSKYVLFERDPETFSVLHQWACDSESIAFMEGRPIFYVDDALFVGQADGTRKQLVECPQPLQHLTSSTSGRKLFGDLKGGIRVWSTDTWQPDIHNSMPSQLDTDFGVDDDGRLRILTDSYHAISDGNSKLHEVSPLPDLMTRFSSYRSLSANGEHLAYIDKEMGVNYLHLRQDSTSPLQLSVPNESRPKRVTISDSGNRVAVVYHPDVRADDPDGTKKVSQQAFQSGARAGLSSRIFGSSNFTEGCAVFELPDTTPRAIGKIGRNAPNATAAQNPYLASERDLICWVGEGEIGRWDFGEKHSTPKTFSTSNEDNFGFCSFNDLGDVIFHRMAPGEQARFQVLWDNPSNPRPELLREEIEDIQLDHNLVFALSRQGRRLFLADSRANKSTISVIQLPTKETVKEFDLPARSLNLRLSPNSKFLGVKLSDSRYAVISVE